MKSKFILKKSLIDGSKEFRIGDDIAFKYEDKYYIGRIVDITETLFTVTDIEMKADRKTGYHKVININHLIIPIDEATEVNYVFYD